MSDKASALTAPTTAHSPSPWRVSIGEVISDNGEKVGVVYRTEGWSSDDRIGYEEQANAALIEMAPDLLRLVITMSASYQGGHCPIGMEVSKLLGIPFPVTMPNLAKTALARGIDPDKMWPWLKQRRGTKAPAPRRSALR